MVGGKIVRDGFTRIFYTLYVCRCIRDARETVSFYYYFFFRIVYYYLVLTMFVGFFLPL